MDTVFRLYHDGVFCGEVMVADVYSFPVGVLGVWHCVYVLLLLSYGSTDL